MKILNTTNLRPKMPWRCSRQCIFHSKNIKHSNTIYINHNINPQLIPYFSKAVLYSSVKLGNWHSVIIPPPNEVGGGGYTGFTLSVRLSVRPSVCRRHGFRSISQVCFGISISNFICILMVAIGRSLLIFSDVTFKMAAWWPYWIFWFPDSNFTSALNINFKLQRHNTYVYG